MGGGAEQGTDQAALGLGTACQLHRQPPRPASPQADHSALGRGKSGWRRATPARDQQHTHATHTTHVSTRTRAHTRTRTCARSRHTHAHTRTPATAGATGAAALRRVSLALCLHSEITLPPPGAIKASSGGGCPGGRWPLGTGHSASLFPDELAHAAIAPRWVSVSSRPLLQEHLRHC